MAEKRGKIGPSAHKIVKEEEGFVEIPIDENPLMGSVSSPSELELAQVQLRGRWELASVLNFLHVFEPIIRSDLEITAEEIELALITPNNALAQLHIALLKGIPPISKSLMEPDAWVTVLCKKLFVWWPWVAEGEVPLVAAHGEEISRYKEIGPTTRLLMLKALCEVRAEQDDTSRYIDDALKHGTELSTFRKDKIGGDGNGTVYWHDGDSIIGHRLYREISTIESNLRLKGKSRLIQPALTFQWETLATNLEEFYEISDKFSFSKSMVEASVANIVKNDIIPALEQLRKKKERALKRQQRQAMQLDSLISSDILNNRSRRDRRPVSYTFDEYDRCIDEAIKKGQTTLEQKDEGKHGGESTEGQKEAGSNGIVDLENDNPTEMENHDSLPDIGKDDDKYRGGGGDDDSEDDDYDDKNDNDDDDQDEDDEDDDDDDNDDDDHEVGSGDSDKENNNKGQLPSSRNTRRQKVLPARDITGLRRSARTAALVNNIKRTASDLETETHGDTKRLMQKHVLFTISDSEDDNDQLKGLDETGFDTEKESGTASDGMQVEGEEENDVLATVR